MADEGRSKMKKVIVVLIIITGILAWSYDLYCFHKKQQPPDLGFIISPTDPYVDLNHAYLIQPGKRSQKIYVGPEKDWWTESKNWVIIWFVFAIVGMAGLQAFSDKNNNASQQ